MSKVGRNDPCPCGSGKKYKHCHLPIDEAAQSEERRLRQVPDALLPRIIEQAQMHTETIPAAFQRFWNGKYTAEQMSEVDELEGHGAERFLSWFAFDFPLDDGRTLVERIAAGEGELELSDAETLVAKDWGDVRLRPYVIEQTTKGQGMTVRDLLDERTYMLEDQAASRRVAIGEVLVVHLLPAAGRFYIAGAAAHLTSDTAEKLREFAELHLAALRREQPDASWDDLLRQQSEVLNHFVMALPVEGPDPSIMETILLQTRTALHFAGESLGFVKADAATTPEQTAKVGDNDKGPS